nr:hypothetical protein BaRGS_006714 [Batillaria attramentaria]
MRYNRTELDKVMPKDAFYCAIMREPVSRFVSAMYYFGVLKPPSTKNVSQVSPGFSKFLSETGRKGLEVRPLPELLYNSIAFDTGLALTQQKSIEAVEQHIAKLDRELDLMMVMEYFHESLVLLKRRARLQLKDIIHVKLNSKRPRSTHLISDSDLKTLKDWQMADHKIYDHFLAKFWKEVRKEGPDFQDEVGRRIHCYPVGL